MVDQVITTQELIDAQKDAQTLEEVVNGPANTNVTSRLGRIFPTLATLAQTIFTTSVVMEGNKTQQQINADFSTADENIEAALYEKESISNKGAPNGYLGLDENGKATAGQLPAATETQVGVAEIATQTEVNTGVADDKIITPLKLKSVTDALPLFTSAQDVIDVTASRTSGTIYTNGSKPKFIAIDVNNSSTGDSVLFQKNNAGNWIGMGVRGSGTRTVYALILPLRQYKYESPTTFAKWVETVV